MKTQKISSDSITDTLYECAATLASDHWELSVGIIGSFVLLCHEFAYISLHSYPMTIWIIATVVYLCGVRRWYVFTWQFNKKYIAYTDALMFVGIMCMYIYATACFFIGSHQQLATFYVPTITYLTTGMLLFDYIRASICAYSVHTLQTLHQAQPSTADTQQGDEWRNIPTEQVVVADHIKVALADMVPADGTIVTGVSSMDEHIITGTQTLAFKEPGDKVFAGAVNMTGIFEMRVEKTGNQTKLSKIIAILHNAYQSSFSLISMAEKLVLPALLVLITFVIIVFLLWLLFGLTSAITTASSILCGVLLYTPILSLKVAIAAGIGRMAQLGILIKDAEIFADAHKIDSVVFNKTGTLTYGEYKVYLFECVSNIADIFTQLQWLIPAHVSAESYVKALVRAVETLTDHAVAHAVVEYLSEYQLLPQSILDVREIEDYTLVPGLGVHALFKGHTIRIGSKKYMEQEGVDVSLIDQIVHLWAVDAYTVSFVAFDNQLVAYFSVADGIRPEVVSSIARLKRKGIKTILITGDDLATAQAIAQSVGIDEVLACVTTQEKASYVRALRSSYQSVAMVADCTQDKLVLAAAQISIGFCNGIDSESDIVLLREDMSLIPQIIESSRGLMHIMYQNSVISLFYMSLMICLACGVWYLMVKHAMPPLYSGISMIIVSIVLLLHALRARMI
jgi:Cu+-exporting ATPase